MRRFTLILLLFTSLGMLISPQVSSQSLCTEPAVILSDPSELWYVNTNGQALTVREYPAVECVALEVLPNGTVIEVTGHVEGWQQVRLEDGRTGYVAVFLVAPFSQVAQQGTNIGIVLSGARQQWTYQGIQGEILDIQLSPVSNSSSGGETESFDASLGIYKPDTNEFGDNRQETLHLTDVQLMETGTYIIEVVIRAADRSIETYELNIESTPPPLTTTPITPETPIVNVSDTSTRHTNCPKPQGWFDYVIRDGETISALAARFGTSTDYLKAQNCLSSNLIYVGQRIYAPQSAEGPTPTLPSAILACVPSVPAGWVYFTIRPGDTLSGLADVTGTSVNELRVKNCLKSNEIVAGEQIFLPKLPPTQTPQTPPCRDCTPTPTPCQGCPLPPPPPPEPRTISISLGSPGTYGSHPQGYGCDVMVYVTVTGVDSVSAVVYVSNDSNIFPHPPTTFARGTSGGYNVTIGGVWPQYKEHVVWVSSSIGESTREGVTCGEP